MKTKLVLILALGFICFSDFTTYAFEKCIMCGMDAEKSETKFAIQLSEGTTDIPAGGYSFCCLHCLVIFKHRIGKGKISSVLVRDYCNRENMIDAKKAFYLVESKLHPRDSMVPFMLIFSSEKDGQMFKKEFGGRILDWKNIWKYVENK